MIKENYMFFPLRWQSNKNVLFIIPELSSIFPNGVEDSQDVDVIHPPLGVLYLSSYCKSNGYRTFVIDQMSGNYYNEEKLIDFIQFNHINIVGISCTMSAVFDESLKYATICKNQGCVTVLGGAHVSATIESSVNNWAIDIVSYGEGENTWIELLKCLNSGLSISGVQGIAYKNLLGKIIIEKRRNLISNLDSIPFPDYDAIDIKKYIDLEALGIITSRGCSNHCTFCTSYCTWEQKVRFRSPENIISEIDWLVKKYDYGGKELLFYDDNFTLNKKRVLKFCELLCKKNYKIKWKCMSRVNGIDIKLFEAMKEAGCYSVSFGFESGVEKSLKMMGKGITLDDIEKAIDICVQTGIEAYGYFIIGFPWETREDFNTTVDFIINHPQINPALNFLTPYPGTTYYEEPEKWGITIDKDWKKYTNLSVVMTTNNYSIQDLFDSYTRYLIYMEGKQHET